MPVTGERKVRDGVLGEFDGTTWRVVAEPGTRKTKGNVTAEWDGTTWRQITDAGESGPAQTSKPQTTLSGPAVDVAGGALTTGMAAAPAGLRLANAGARAVMGPYGPAIAGAIAASGKVRRGDYFGAAQDAVVTAAGAQAAKPVASAIAKQVALRTGPIGAGSMIARLLSQLAPVVGVVTAAEGARRDLVDYAAEADDTNLTPTERAAREAIAAAIRGGGVM
jgi:hypothetical protein